MASFLTVSVDTSTQEAYSGTVRHSYAGAVWLQAPLLSVTTGVGYTRLGLRFRVGVRGRVRGSG